MLAVPDRAEQRVREPQVEELVEAELPEEVVDPEELVLLDHAVQLPRERLGRGEVVPERLLDHDPRPARQPRAAELRDDDVEQRRRRLEVEHRPLRAPQLLAQTLVGRRVGEVARDVRQTRSQAVEHLLLELLAARHDRLAHVRAEVRERPVVDRDADDRAVEQPAALEPVERSERHDLREIARDPEGDERVGSGLQPSPSLCHG